MQVKDFDWNNPCLIRAGLIAIARHGRYTFLGFGVDSGIASLTDFGGHWERYDGDALDTALREYREESFSIFGHLTRASVADCLVLPGADTAEILLPVTGSLLEYSAAFARLVSKSPDNEAQALVWLTMEQVFQLLECPKASFRGTKVYHMYYRIWDTLAQNKDLLRRINEEGKCYGSSSFLLS